MAIVVESEEGKDNALEAARNTVIAARVALDHVLKLLKLDTTSHEEREYHIENIRDLMDDIEQYDRQEAIVYTGTILLGLLQSVDLGHVDEVQETDEEREKRIAQLHAQAAHELDEMILDDDFDHGHGKMKGWAKDWLVTS